MTARGLEEKALPLFPQLVCVVGGDCHRRQDTPHENFNLFWPDAETPKLFGVGEQDKVALVGKKGVGSRVQSDNCSPVQIGRPERSVLGLSKRKVDEAIIDEVDRAALALLFRLNPRSDRANG